jgi:hypothetical protein
LIPTLPFGHNVIFQAKYQEATLKHMKLTHYGTGNFTTFAFTNPDKPCNFMDGGSATIRSMILKINARDTARPLFLALNPATKPQEKGKCGVVNPLGVSLEEAKCKYEECDKEYSALKK